VNTCGDGWTMSDLPLRSSRTLTSARIPAESMKVTPERSIRTLASAPSMTASEACSSNESALARSISPRTRTPSDVLSRAQVSGMVLGTVYTYAIVESNRLLA